MKPFIKIGKRKIGSNHPPLVIPDIGINHEGSVSKAKKMIQKAHKSGAECVKFQCHIIEDEMIPAAKKVIPGNAKESIWSIMSRCALSEKQDRELKKYTESLGMIYLSTPFSRAAANRLHKMKVLAYKIGSGECNNYPLIEHIASFKKPIILSTGMNNLTAVKKSVAILKKHKVPYAIMHCISIYPTPYDKVNLNAIKILKTMFPGAVIGFSDHSVSNYPCFAAATYGASILEKHFTADKRWPGPDMPLSIDPPGLKDLLDGTRAIHQVLGGTKKILPEEKPTIKFAYACVVCIANIKQREKLTAKNIWVKRPGTGPIKAEYYNKLLGKTAKRDIAKDQQISWQDIK